MEVMSVSLDNFYRLIHRVLHTFIREDILGKIACAVSSSHNMNYPISGRGIHSCSIFLPVFLPRYNNIIGFHCFCRQSKL